MSNTKKKEPAIEEFLDALTQEQDSARELCSRLHEQYNLARFNYNTGRGRWRDVYKVVLVPGTVYLVRRAYWKTTARRSVKSHGPIALARWHVNASWEVLRGDIPAPTARFPGIQVYE
jgi:hypothetical protein